MERKRTIFMNSSEYLIKAKDVTAGQSTTRLRKQEGTESESECDACHYQKKVDDPNIGFYLINDGTCRVVNHDDQYSFQILKKGDFFGEAEILKTVDFCFFGDIIAHSPTVECLFIPAAEFKKIPQFEQILIKKYAENRQDINILGLQYSKRYNVDIQEYTNFYS